MNVLLEAAHGVETAWCQGDLRREAESKDAGDAFCAVGRLADSLAKVQGLEVSLNGSRVGSPEAVAAFDSAVLQNRNAKTYSDYVNFPDQGLTGTYEFVRRTDEAKAVAEVILDKYASRVGNEASITGLVDVGYWDDIIYMFNDHENTTREEVVAVFREAATK